MTTAVRPPPLLAGATLAAIQAQDPATYSSAMRAGIADRCRGEALRRFARLKPLKAEGRDDEAARVEATARDWMREVRRWGEGT